MKNVAESISVLLDLRHLRDISIQEEKVRYLGTGYVLVLRMATGFSHPLTQNATLSGRRLVQKQTFRFGLKQCAKQFNPLYYIIHHKLMKHCVSVAVLGPPPPQVTFMSFSWHDKGHFQGHNPKTRSMQHFDKLCLWLFLSDVEDLSALLKRFLELEALQKNLTQEDKDEHCNEDDDDDFEQLGMEGDDESSDSSDQHERPTQ